MKKSLNWTWVGVAGALIIYFIMYYVNDNIFTSIISSLLQAWAVIFFACFGYNKCLKKPFNQRILWVSLACAAGFAIITELISWIRAVLLNIILNTEKPLPFIIESIMYTIIIELALFILVYFLTRLFIDEKSVFAFKWNKWMVIAVVLAVAFVAFKVYTDFAMWEISNEWSIGSMNMLSMISFFDVVSYYGKLTSIITIVVRGTLLFFIGAGTLESKPRLDK